MSKQIQLRRDSAANWASTNPIIGQGEPGYEVDTGLMKLGDGVNNWNSLSYFGATASGTVDHGLLTGLGDDDHTQYILANGTRDFTNPVGGITPIADADLSTKGYVDTISGTLHAEIATISISGSGVTDHGLLTGLGDDDHTQYLNTTRGDARYYTETEIDSNYYTTSQVDTISGSLSAEIDSDITVHATSSGHDGRYYTKTGVDGLIQDHRENPYYGVASDLSYTYAGSGYIDVPDTDVVINTEPDWSGDFVSMTASGTTLYITENELQTIVVRYVTDHVEFDVLDISEVYDKNDGDVVVYAGLYRLGDNFSSAYTNYQTKAVAERLNMTSQAQGITVESTTTSFVVSISGSNYLNISRGGYYLGMDYQVQPPYDSNYNRLTFFYHTETPNVWNYTISGTLNNQYYDDGEGLVELTDGYYTNCWIYKTFAIENVACYMSSLEEYATLEEALAADLPQDLPQEVYMSVLCARVTMQKGVIGGTVRSAFVTKFAGIESNNHNALNSLQGGASTEYYHLSSLEHANITNGNPTVESVTVTNGFIGDGSGITNISHTTLSGLDSDDHTQYLNTTRGDVRYHTKEEITTISGNITTQEEARDKYLTNILSTGLFDGGVLSINSQDSTKFDIASGWGMIVDNYTDASDPVRKVVTWPTTTGIADLYLGSSTTGIYVIKDTAGDGVGTISQKDTFIFTEDEKKDDIIIGYTIHPGPVISNISNKPYYIPSVSNQMYDFFDSFGPFNISGNDYTTLSGLYIERSGGTTYEVGANYSTSAKSPNVIETSFLSPVTDIYYFNRTASGTWAPPTAPTDTIDPDYYDTTSGIVNVPSDYWTIQPIMYRAVTGLTGMYYGQVIYSDKDSAVSAVNVPVEVNPLLATSNLRGWLIVKQGATDLLDTDQAVMVNTSNFGSSGASTPGEEYTYSNSGLSGVGITLTTLGTDFRFKAIDAGSDKVTVTNDNSNKTIDIDVVPSNISHATISGLSADDHTQYFNTSRGDDRYYTQPEVDTISGSLNNYIETFTTNLASSYYTSEQVDTISGALSSEHYNDERAQDAIGNIVSGAGLISVNYNDSTPSITISGSQDSTKVDTTHIAETTDRHPYLTNALSTGLFDGGILSINSEDATKFDITAGWGMIVNNYTDPANPTRKIVSWTTITGISDLYVASSSTTGIYIEKSTAGDGVGTISQQDSFNFTQGQLNDIIVIGSSIHPGPVISNISNRPYYIPSATNQLYSFLESFGAFNVSGNNYTTLSGLSVARSAGTVYEVGSNYSSSKKSPNIIETVSENPVSSFYYFNRTVSGTWAPPTAPVSVIDPDYYDTGSGIAAVPSGYWSAQPIMYRAVTLLTAFQYGQNIYADKEAAVAGVNDSMVINPLLDSSVFRGWLVVKQGSTDLSDSDQATVVDAGKFGLISSTSAGGGSSGEGEVNTYSNAGLTGVGITLTKTGVNLPFKAIDAGSNKITVTNDAVNKTVDIDVVQANLDHGSIGGLGDDDHSQYHNNTRGDTRYYTQSQVSTISGTLQTGIDTKVNTADHTELAQDVIGSSISGINIDIDYNDTTGITTLSGVDGILPSNAALTDSDQTMTGGWTFSTVSPEFTISPVFANDVQWLAKNSTGSAETCFYARASDNNTYLNYGGGGHFYIRNNSNNIQYDFRDTVLDCYDSDITTTGDITADTFNGDGSNLTGVSATFGSDYAYVKADTSSSTTSTTYQQKATLSVTGLTSGYYRIGWYYEWEYRSASYDFRGRIQLDNTTTVMEHRQEPKDSGTDQWYPASGFDIVQLDGNHTFDLDYCSSRSGTTANIRRVRLELWRVS